MNVKVTDPFGAARDKDFPTLARALSPDIARAEFKRRLPLLSADGILRLRAIRVTRHKPGRRCVAEYDVVIRRPNLVDRKVTLVGKSRHRRSGNEAFHLQRAIWESGFQSDSADGISVPEPVGVIPLFKMWFQRKIPGITVEDLLTSKQRLRLARRVTEAVHKLHCIDVHTAKRHTIEDELLILEECLSGVALAKPHLGGRLNKVFAACQRLASVTPPPIPCGIHRDFYPSQLIADGTRLWLLDFDLYCIGDPALDIGNFIGHVTEKALRELGNAKALESVERTIEDRFVELCGEQSRAPVRTYTLLTLVRHIFLSTRFPERVHVTERLLELCESRLPLS